MPRYLYKILRLDDRRERILGGPVKAREEEWPALDDALADLGVDGWEIVAPIYAPAPMPAACAGGQWCEALILRNAELSEEQEKERQISRLAKLADEARAGAAAAQPDSMERNLAEQRVRELQAKLTEAGRQRPAG